MRCGVWVGRFGEAELPPVFDPMPFWVRVKMDASQIPRQIQFHRQGPAFTDQVTRQQRRQPGRA